MEGRREGGSEGGRKQRMGGMQEDERVRTEGAGGLRQFHALPYRMILGGSRGGEGERSSTCGGAYGGLGL